MEYDTKTDRRKLLGISMRVILALVLVGLLVAPLAVQADLKSTDVVYAFDIVANAFQNSMVITPWDGTWVPFLHELYFDTDEWINPMECDPEAGEGPSTRWAGNLEYGLVYIDSNPLGGLGFLESRKWSLISCDRNGDESGTFDAADREPPPSPYDRGEYRETMGLAKPWGPYAECTPDGIYCKVIEQDFVQPCSTGTCEAEIVTLLQVNLDTDCDGDVDPELIAMGLPVDLVSGEPEMLCFYAEGRTPYEAAYWEEIVLPPYYPDPPDLSVLPYPRWKGNPQGRISVGGGDKTVNFDIDSVTAVELAAFDAAAQANGVMLNWETATELDNLGFNIYRADSQVGEMNKINPRLIPSRDPGSTVGASYSFLDESAVPGATYYYWLEDVDVAGATEMNGPVAAKMRAVRGLPGRGRPAPMPGNAY